MSDHMREKLGGRRTLGLLASVVVLGAILEGIGRLAGRVDSGRSLEEEGVPVEVATAIRSDISDPVSPRERSHVALLVVPREAVVQTAGGTAVVLYRSGRACAVPVTTGAANDSFAELLSGVREGDTVITAACGPIRDGDPVRVLTEAFPGDDERCREWESAAPSVVRTTHAERPRVPSPLEAEGTPENNSSLFMKGR
jgi:hypothetical protein